MLACLRLGVHVKEVLAGLRIGKVMPVCDSRELLPVKEADKVAGLDGSLVSPGMLSIIPLWFFDVPRL